MTRMRKVLIALDATDEAEDVLEGATSVDPRGAVEYQVITVVPPLVGGVSGMDGASFAASWPLRDMEETIAAETTRYVRERAAAFGIEPQKVATRIGRPAVEIRAHAEHIGADLIVIGSHGRHGITGLLLGSTANGVIHNSPCDVLIIRIQADEGDEKKEKSAKEKSAKEKSAKEKSAKAKGAKGKEKQGKKDKNA